MALWGPMKWQRAPKRNIEERQEKIMVLIITTANF